MSLYNEDELTPPQWINKDFLTKVLSKYEHNDNIEILDINIMPASMKGDHYGSIMFRCKVKYSLDSTTERNCSLIIKTIPDVEGMKRDMLAESKLFETEILMYTKTLPKIEQVLSQHGDPTKLCAEIFYHSLEPHKVLILEDLCELGYNIKRGGYPNNDELKAIYTKLSKMHAVSHMLGQSEEHDYVTQYQDNLFNVSGDMIKQLLDNGIQNFSKALKKQPELSKYLEAILSMELEIKKKSKELYDAYRNKSNAAGDDGNIFVLNHGDFHLKNLMFKHNPNTKALEDLVFVDYQISMFAPSNADLIYSQYTMLSPEVRLKRHEWMRFYYDEFIATLKKIKYTGTLPKYSQLQMNNLKYRHLNLFLITTFLPMVTIFCKTAEELKDTDVTKLLESPEMMGEAFNSPEYINDMKQHLPILFNEGFMD